LEQELILCSAMFTLAKPPVAYPDTDWPLASYDSHTFGQLLGAIRTVTDLEFRPRRGAAGGIGRSERPRASLL
jgi:hypothetical protein